MASEVIVTEDQADTEITVPQGTEVKIHLKEIGSTGFRWTDYKCDSPAVAVYREVRESDNPENIGSRQTLTITLKAVYPGKSRFMTHYRREWEPLTKIRKTFSITITVT